MAKRWRATGCHQVMMIIYMTILINTFQAGFTCIFANGCILDLNSSSIHSKVCEGGDWGGFLKEKCCGGAFQEYLYALGMSANETGQIHLDSTEQMNCLIRIDLDILGCGIEKLTTSKGGCSNYSVSDVNERLGRNLESLKDGCDFSDVGEGWEQSCGSCLKIWKEMKGMHSNSGELSDIDSDVCRFSVLVSVTSTRIKDEVWIRKLYNCLGNQRTDAGSEAEESAESDKPRLAWKPALLKESDDLKVPIKEVYTATNNLDKSNFIGEGTAGKVYKGILSNNQQEVAIKHISNDGCSETFLREVRSLSHVTHPNLVSLLGYCEKEGECFLIYEFCPNGNLSEWLFGKDKVLSWIRRLEIALDSARGLCFLHTYPQGCIVHRDVKPTNILLGRNFEAKLSDFGLSKVIDLGETYASSEVRGTFGYVDPEYQSNRRVNSASDIYSFGIVLLQILSGRKAINMNTRKPMPLDKIAKTLTRDGSRLDFADPRLHGEHSVEAFEFTFELALSCIAPKQQRPSIEQVVKNLEEAISISTNGKARTPVSTSDPSMTP